MSTVRWHPLTDHEWARICHLFANGCDGRVRGRPRVSDRTCLNGILWMMQTGGQWKALPEEFGSRQTAWRRRREWTDDGTLERVMKALPERRVGGVDVHGGGTVTGSR